MPICQEPPASSAKNSRSLTRGLITDAAIAYIETHGIDRLSMRNLAKNLDCGTMTMYSYVASRDDLILAIIEELIVRSRLPQIARHNYETWQEFVREFCAAYLELAYRYPQSHELLALAPYDVEPVASHLETLISALRRTGLAAESAYEILGAIDAYLTGFLTVSVRSASRAASASPAGTETLRRLRAPEAFARGLEVFLIGFELELTRRHSNLP